MKYASNNIRNILIAGHAGSGKTTLTEALVYFSGAAERMGRVEDGSTVSDFDPEEAKRKASLSASVVPVEYDGIKYNLIDAPGLFDFEAGEYEGIRAAESVLVCVSGRSGVTVGAEKAFQLARKNGKAAMVFVTKCDLENANYFKILEDMKIKFGSTVCPCVVPAKLDDGTPVYINLFSQKAFKYEGGKQVQIDLPDIGHRFQGLIEAMSEAIAETDDELMEKFFGGEPFTTEEIVEGMEDAEHDHDHDAEEHDHEEEHQLEPGQLAEVEYDEHIWTSPVNAMEIVQVICQTLSSQDPENREIYEANAAAYEDHLLALDQAFRDAVAAGTRDMIVVADRFPFRYLAETYGISYRAAFSGCSGDTEPSARTIAYLIDQVREKDLPAVYYLELSSHRVAEIISEETGARTLLLHSCHNVTRQEFDEGVTYLQLMEQNVENLKTGLGAAE